MNLKQAKDYFKVGAISGFALHRETLGEGWVLWVDGKAPDHLETATGHVRVFAGVDTALKTVSSITGRPVANLKLST